MLKPVVLELFSFVLQSDVIDLELAGFIQQWQMMCVTVRATQVTAALVTQVMEGQHMMGMEVPHTQGMVALVTLVTEDLVILDMVVLEKIAPMFVNKSLN